MNYPQFSLDYIENELPMGFGWALIAFCIENNGWHQFCGLKRIGRSYSGQEVDKLKQQYYDAKKKS